MKGRRLEYGILLFTAVFFMGSANVAAQETDSSYEILQKYCDYLETHPISDYLGNSELYNVEWMEESLINTISILDLDNDGEPELEITGRGASANTLAGILDIVDGEPVCVLSEWANIRGWYYDDITDQEYLAVWEGNGAEDWYEFRISLYDGSWNRLVLASSSWLEGRTDFSYDRDGNRISQEEFDFISEEMRNGSTQLEPEYVIVSEVAEGMTVGESVEKLKNYMDELDYSVSDLDEHDGDIDTWEGIIDSFLTDSPIGGCWFYISDSYEKGIAVRVDTSTKAELLCRLPYGTGFFADQREGEWVHTAVNGCDGWVNINYIDVSDDCYAEGSGVGSISVEGSWYYISSHYEKGIAVRAEPSADSKLLCRIPYGTEFWVETFSKSWGFTTVNGFTGWIDTDYAAQLDESDSTNELNQLTEDQATTALTNYIDEQYGLETVYEYHGGICFDEKLKEAYRFVFRSYTGAYAYFYVYFSTGDIYMEQKNPITMEYEDMEYVCNAFDYF